MRVYLDYQATTPVDPAVAKEMWPYFMDEFGNPASVHAMGEDAKTAVEESRERVAAIIKAKSDNVYFTNSATEANNVVLKGFTGLVMSTNAEHSSIKNCLEKYPENSIIIDILSDGNLDYKNLEENLKLYREHPKLVTIIAANNEIGTVHDLHHIGDLCKQYGALFHTDATQAVGKVDIDVDDMNIFALTMSGHKIYGPKGVGALYVRDESLIEPLTDGGYQNTFVSGTQNVPAIVGLGKACEMYNNGAHKNHKIEQLRNKMLKLLQDAFDDLVINGTMLNRLPNNLNISIPGVNTEILVRGMDDVIISGGAACTSGFIGESHVIQAIQAPHKECAIRISVGRFTTEDEIDYAAKRIIEIAKDVRGE